MSDKSAYGTTRQERALSCNTSGVLWCAQIKQIGSDSYPIIVHPEHLSCLSFHLLGMLYFDLRHPSGFYMRNKFCLTHHFNSNTRASFISTLCIQLDGFLG